MSDFDRLAIVSGASVLGPLLFGAVGLVLLRRQRRHVEKCRLRNCCVHCGYDLTGNTSDVCPECGADVDMAADRLWRQERVTKVVRNALAYIGNISPAAITGEITVRSLCRLELGDVDQEELRLLIEERLGVPIPQEKWRLFVSLELPFGEFALRVAQCVETDVHRPPGN